MTPGGHLAPGNGDGKKNVLLQYSSLLFAQRQILYKINLQINLQKLTSLTQKKVQ